MPARTENGGNRWRVGVQAKEVKCLESQPQDSIGSSVNRPKLRISSRIGEMDEGDSYLH